MDDPDCGGSEMPVECEFSMWFQETIDMNEYGGCEEYVRGSNAMPEDVTEEQICDTSGGVPALAYGITMTIFPDRTGIMKLPVAERKARPWSAAPQLNSQRHTVHDGGPAEWYQGRRLSGLSEQLGPRER